MGNKVNADIETESVLDIAKDKFPGVEIKPKPPSLEEKLLLETSQILILMGSAFLSFCVVMIAFFLLRKTMDKKTPKYVPYIVPSTVSPIVKSYHRVPSYTAEYLNLLT